MGYTTKRQFVRGYQKTVSEKIPQKMGAPKGCGITEGPVECLYKAKAILVDNPLEE